MDAGLAEANDRVGAPGDHPHRDRLTARRRVEGIDPERGERRVHRALERRYQVRLPLIRTRGRVQIAAGWTARGASPSERSAGPPPACRPARRPAPGSSTRTRSPRPRSDGPACPSACAGCDRRGASDRSARAGPVGERDQPGVVRCVGQLPHGPFRSQDGWPRKPVGWAVRRVTIPHSHRTIATQASTAASAVSARSKVAEPALRENL